jgi:uncharacterized membrane protein
MDSSAIIAILLGIYALTGAGFNWNWFMEDRKSRFFSKILGGRDRARIFYIVVGIVLLIYGTLGLFGVVEVT